MVREPGAGVERYAFRVREGEPSGRYSDEPPEKFKVGDKVVRKLDDRDDIGTVSLLETSNSVLVDWDRTPHPDIASRCRPEDLRKATPEEVAKAEKIEKNKLPACHICGQTYALFPCIECGKLACSKHQTTAGCDACRKAEKEPEPPAIPSNRCRLCKSILVTEQSKSLGLCEGCRAKRRRHSAPSVRHVGGVALGVGIMFGPLVYFMLKGRV